MSTEILTVCSRDNHTRFNAERILNHLFSFCAKPFDQIEKPDIQAWLHSMEEQGIPPYMVHSKLFAVQLFYEQCIKENVLKRNPCLFVEMYEFDEWKSEIFGQPVITETRLYLKLISPFLARSYETCTYFNIGKVEKDGQLLGSEYTNS